MLIKMFENTYLEEDSKLPSLKYQKKNEFLLYKI